MDLGIIGLPQVGKKTLFGILTGVSAAKAPTRDGIARGIAPVRDPRIDTLSAMYNPKRTRYAEFDITLPPDVHPSTARSAEWLDPIRRSDALVHVVRAFDDPTVFHIEGNTDPLRDIATVEMEFLLADLDLAETRLERMARDKHRLPRDAGQRNREGAVLERCRKHLEDENPLRTLALNSDEETTVKSLQFLTRKPTILVLNVGENLEAAAGQYAEVAATREAAGDTVALLSAAIEAEMAELEPDEQAEFMEELGLTEPAAHRLSRAAYASLGLISYFTVGPDEVRAWTVRCGARAPEAAGRIHSDLERGFIRADTVPYDAFVAAGSEKAARDAKLYRLQGKEYEVRDGDIMEIRFNV